MSRDASVQKSFGLQFDPRAKIIILILCVISATIASSLLYESLLVLAVALFGCASGKVRRSLFCAAFYGAFYMLTLFIMSLEKGAFYTVFTSWARPVLRCLPLRFFGECDSFHDEGK